ncbi:MAG: hypothetical protein HQL94_06945 [Magnetococcales bacterium]|nr:hypothetical protein [Magnetococcales bacterium]
MGKKVLVLDTTLLVVWLRFPGENAVGPKDDLWTFDRIDQHFKESEQQGATFVLPLATIIETGNMICKCEQHCRENLSKQLAEIIRKCASGDSPWALFSDQSVLWTPAQLVELAETWPSQINYNRCHSLGDATIKTVAEYYTKSGFAVEIATGDAGLKYFQYPQPQPSPRRRR